MEHRHGTRHAVAWPVLLSIGNRRHRGAITDVSLTGAYVRTNARVHPPAFVRLRIEGASFWQPRMPVLVVRTGSHGIGVEWQEEMPLGELLPRLDRTARPQGFSTSAPCRSPRRSLSSASLAAASGSARTVGRRRCSAARRMNSSPS